MVEQNLAIEIKGLKKTYQKSANAPAKIALNNINLEVKSGSIFGLLGPNGAGKSTIINIMAGLVNKSAGQVKIAGHDLETQTLLAKSNIGIVPQELIIDPFFNVYETLEIYAGYFGIRPKDRRTKEIIKDLGLEDKIKARPRTLSGGMKRRLLIAKALVHNPKVLVLDEPTAGVDVDLRTSLWEYVKKLNKKGTTIVLTTHYLEEAENLCDEIAIIDGGKVIARDKKEKLMKMMPENKELTVNLREEISMIPAEITKKFKNLTIELASKNIMRINYDPSKNNVADILLSLEKIGVKIADISTSQPDLEKVFKFLTKNSPNKNKL